MAKRTSPRRRRGRLELGTIALVPTAILLIVISQVANGMPAAFLLNWPAALIVIGGTATAVMVSFRPREIGLALRTAGRTFRTSEHNIDALATALVTFSIQAYRQGLMSIEMDADLIQDRFLRDGVLLVADAESTDTLREWLAAESEARSADDELPARIFEAAAGYAPTLGILGAVLGLAQVMQRLSAPGVLGGEIAVAFVATIYGVGAANLVLLPIAGRIREHAAVAARRRDMITQALCSIRAGRHPRLVAQKLRAYSSALPQLEEAARRSAVTARGDVMRQAA